jgi:hypothetical protein
MSTNDNTNTNNGTDAFAALADALAGFGHSLEPRTRLTFGRQAAKALAGVMTGGFVVVMTKGTTDKDATAITDKIAQAPKGTAAVVDARDADFAQVRPNVNSYLTSRKIGAKITPPRKDADDNKIGFVIRKTA